MRGAKVYICGTPVVSVCMRDVKYICVTKMAHMYTVYMRDSVYACQNAVHVLLCICATVHIGEKMLCLHICVGHKLYKQKPFTFLHSIVREVFYVPNKESLCPLQN